MKSHWLLEKPLPANQVSLRPYNYTVTLPTMHEEKSDCVKLGSTQHVSSQQIKQAMIIIYYNVLEFLYYEFNDALDSSLRLWTLLSTKVWFLY